MLAVDQINTWSVPSVYGYDGKKLLSSDICVPYALDFTARKKKDVLNKVNVKNGLCIGATSFKHVEGNKTDFLDVANSFPLLVQVPVYSRIEYLSIVQCYTHHGIFDNAHTTDEIVALRSYCSSNPRLIAKEAGSFLLPISDSIDDNTIAASEQADSSRNSMSKSDSLGADSEFWYDNSDKMFDVATKAPAATDDSPDAPQVGKKKTKK